ncbi:hypothetical protein C0992_008608 [Termitomyces sp. T32_za158]|nr:hypothetical protein C0992_008608 [Termitomyces sp. T32_za158]
MSGSTSSETTSDSTSSAPLRPRTHSQRACSASIPLTSCVPRSGLQPTVEHIIKDDDSPLDPKRGELEGESDTQDNINVALCSSQCIHSLGNGSLQVLTMESVPAPSHCTLALSSVTALIVPPAPTTLFSPHWLQPSPHLPPRTLTCKVPTLCTKDPAASQRDPVVFFTADGFLQSIMGSHSEMVTLSRADLVDPLKSFGSSVAQALPGPSLHAQPLPGPSAVGPAFPAPSSPTPALLQAENRASHGPLPAVHPALHPTTVLQTGPAFMSASTSTSHAAPDGAPDMSAPLLNFTSPAAQATLTPNGVFPLLQVVPSLPSMSGSHPLLGAPPASAMELDPNVMSIPLRIQRVLNAGWSTYVPLDLLTNAACHRALTALNRHKGPQAIVEVVEASVSHTNRQVEISQTNPLNVWFVDTTTIVLETAQGKERSYATSTDVGQIPKVSAIAFLTMDPTPILLPIVPTAMLVRSAAMANTQHRLALLDEFCPISTPLKVDRWIAALTQTDALDCFAHVIEGLQIGFSLGSLFLHVSQTFL